MKKIVAFAGSTSTTSINKQLITFVASKLNNVEVQILDLNDFELPLYSETVEKEMEYPENAEKFNNLLDASDAFVVSLAEHNGSYAAGFKNLFDWVSRKEQKVFRNKPLLLMATSPGGRGGASVLASAQATFPHMGAKLVGTFSLPKFYDVFKNGAITDKELLEELNSQVAEFEKSL